MSSSGGGPSRRSHTKSRKGCKTCKRRHIRCDETFPQCRNCTKHQVTCDYRENVSSEEQTSQPPVADLHYPLEIEATIDAWQRSGECSLGSFTINLLAHNHLYTRNDLQLIYHALWSANHPVTNEFTVWTGKTPKFLTAATSQPFLVHAVLAFGSSTLAWGQNSSEAKNLAYHHGVIALQGLQNAISMFSKENADAVLAASILLSWQANEWRSWSSLVSGIRTVINSMQAWRTESQLPDILAEQEASIPHNFPGFISTQFAEDPQSTRATSLRQIHESFDSLVTYLCLREEEASWVEQLKDYIQQLLGLAPPRNPEEQFNHLYTFRKWLFCIPTALLKSDTRDYQTLLILAYYYATALQLEPLYPNVSAAFCSSIVVKPLEEIFKSFIALQQSPFYANEHTSTLISLLSYPRKVLATYNERKLRQMSGRIPRTPLQSFDRIGSELAHTFEDYRFGTHDSPAFPLCRQMSQVSAVSSLGLGTPFLEVSNFNWDDSSNPSSATSGSIHQRHNSSYTMPTMSVGSYDQDDIFAFDGRTGSVDFKAFARDPAEYAFVASPPLWT